MNKRQLAITTTNFKILKQLARDEFWYVRDGVAQNPNTSVENLNFLSRDEDSSVRCNVTQNLNTSFETLKQIAIHDEYDYIRYYILQHPNCNDDLYMYIEGRKLLKTLSQLST